MKWPKRFLSLCLALLMCLALLPSTVFADGWSPAIIPGADGSTVYTGSGTNAKSYFVSTAGWYVSLQSAGVIIPEPGPGGSLTLAPGMAASLAKTLTDPAVVHDTDALTTGFFVKAQQCYTGDWNINTCKYLTSAGKTYNFTGTMKTATTDTLKQDAFEQSMDALAKDLYTSALSYLCGSGIFSTENTDKLKQWALTRLDPSTFDAWSSALGNIFPMHKITGIGGADAASANHPSYAQVLEYLAAPGNAVSQYLASTSGKMAESGAGTSIVQMTRYTAVMLCVASANGTQDAEKWIRNIITSYAQFLAGEKYTLYTISLQVWGNGYNVDKDVFMLAQDVLRWMRKGVNYADSSQQRVYQAIGECTWTCGMMLELYGQFGTDNYGKRGRIGTMSKDYNAPAWALTSVDCYTLAALLNSWCSTAQAMPVKDKDPGIKVCGTTYYAMRGCGYIGIPAVLVNESIPDPIPNRVEWTDVIPTGDGKVDPVFSRKDIRVGSGSGTFFIDKSPVVVSESAFTVDKTIGYYIPLKTGAYVDSNGIPHREGGTTTIWDMVMRATSFGTAGVEDARQKYTDWYNSVVAEATELDCLDRVDGLKTFDEYVSTYQYQPKDLAWNLYLLVIKDADVDANDAAELIEENAGYWGDGSEHKHTFVHVTDLYNPRAAGSTEARVRRSQTESSVDVFVQAFNAKYKDVAGVEAVRGSNILVMIYVNDVDKLYEYFKDYEGVDFGFTVEVPYSFSGTIDVEAEETKTYYTYIGGGASWIGMPITQDVTVSATLKETTTIVYGGAYWEEDADGNMIPGTYKEDPEVTGPGPIRDIGPITTKVTTGVRASGSKYIYFPQDYKCDYFAVTSVNPEQPTYHSQVDPNPHAEINQGTVRQNSTGQTGVFNSLTGTPTFTETQRSELINGVTNTSYYNKDGHYYQYFAAGGSEFVVEFDGKYRHDQTATRTFEWNFASGGVCSDSTETCAGVGVDHDHPCTHTKYVDGHPAGTQHGTDPAGQQCGCSEHDPKTLHSSQHPHTIGAVTTSCTVTYTGLSYIEIINLKVWQLQKAKVEGMYDLLDTNAVTAEIMSNAPGISYNIAGANKSATGRMVYDFEPAQNDKVVFNYTLPNTCGGDGDFMQEKIEADIARIKLGAWCVSDYIILHTSDGTESICYYEYKDKNWSEPMDASVSTTSAAPVVEATSNGSASISVSNSIQEFETISYDEIWKSNSYTSEGAGFTPEGITYGGYNGNYQAPDKKYQSIEGNPNNMSWSTWTGTQAYKNASGAHRSCLRTEPSKSLRIMNDRIVIPDSKLNGVYPYNDSGYTSYVFYKNLVDFHTMEGASKPTSYANVSVSRFNGESGFAMRAGYGSDKYGDVVNSVVVYNPVAINAVIASLPSERDQRTETHVPTATDTSYACPGDETCEFQRSICTRTDHLHTEACYTVLQYTCHTPNNKHVHVATATTDGTGYTVPACGYTPPYDYYYCSNCGRDWNSTGCTWQDSGCDWSCWWCYECNSVATAPCPHTDTSLMDWICPYYGNHGGGYVHSGTQIHTSGGGTYSCGNLPLNAHECVAAGTYMCDTSVMNSHTHTSSCYTSHLHTDDCYNGHRHGSYCNTYMECYCSNGHYATYASWVGINSCTCTGHPGHSHVTRYSCGYTEDTTPDCGLSTTSALTCGNLPLNAHVHNDYCPKATVGCYDVSTVVLNCSDPHHTWDSCWKVYTYGLYHKDGQVCTGYNCTNTTPIQFAGKVYRTVAECSAGRIVRHSSGAVHLTCSAGVKCDYCGGAYTEVLFSATNTHRTSVSEDEWSHYRNGDQRCWAACNNAANHNTYSDTVLSVTGAPITNGKFINLDYQFTIYYPNNGNIAGTGRAWSAEATAERGKGYTSNMDTTEWIKYKWVVFPFDVVYDKITYLAGDRIYLSVPDTVFDFYCCLENDEVSDVEIQFGATAINDPYPTTIDDARRNELTNTRALVAYRPMGHGHDVDKRFYIDVVGRIGALTIEDVGDFRYSNFFKQTLEGWLVPNVLRQVNNRVQNNLVIDTKDIRGEPVNNAYFAAGGTALKDASPTRQYQNTWGMRSEREKNLWGFPLVPYMLYLAETNVSTKAQPYSSEQDALATQPMRIGYNAFMDFSTIGNYYGKPQANDELVNKCTVIPHYFRLDLNTGTIKSVDVYMQRNGSYVLINDADRGLVMNSSTPSDMIVSLNWVETKDRRNYNGAEITATELVYEQMGIGMPYGSQWNYGTYDWLTLSGRNRTAIGTEYTYGVSTDPSGLLPGIRSNLQGARWHFSIGLPSSSVFVYAGQPCTQANIDACKQGNCVIIVGLEIYADGDVWSLRYDGSNINQPFKVVKDGPTYNPSTWTNFRYPKDPGGDPEDPTNPPTNPPLVLIEIISIDHSSKEDVNQSGTH